MVGLVAQTARIAFTTWSQGTMSTTESGDAGNSGSSPRPYARISGSAILKPSIHPGYGCSQDDSTMAGRTTDTSTPVPTSATTRSPSALVKV